MVERPLRRLVHVARERGVVVKCLAVDGEALAPRLGDGIHAVLRADMHEIDRAARPLGEPDDAAE